MRKPGVWIGALVGLLLTAPLVGVFYAGWKLAGLPFVPFQIFDWITRLLPGNVITFGIDSMVKVIRALGVAELSSAAKLAEQSMAILIFLVLGAVAGAVLFGILRVLRSGVSVIPGIVLGAAAAVGAVALGRSLGRAQFVSSLREEGWVVAAFLAWGTALGLANRRLTRHRIALRGETPHPEYDARVERLDRRSFRRPAATR